MSECNLTTCPHVRDLETMLNASETNGLRWMRERDQAIREHECCKAWANAARKQRDDAMEAGLDMLDVLTVKASGGVYSPSEETVQRWRNACTANASNERRQELRKGLDYEIRHEVLGSDTHAHVLRGGRDGGSGA